MRARWSSCVVVLLTVWGCGDGIGHPIVGDGLTESGAAAGAGAVAGTGGVASAGGVPGASGASSGAPSGGAGSGGQAGDDPRGSGGSGRERPPPGAGLAPPWEGGLGGWGGAQGGWPGMLPSGEIPPSPECAEVSSWDPAAEDAEWRLYELLLFARGHGDRCVIDPGMPPPPGPSVPPVLMRGELRCAARLHSRDMVDNDYFGHQDGANVGPEDRMRSAGYVTFRAASETIAGDQRAPGPVVPSEVILGILAAGGPECENLVDDDFDAVGIGVYAGVVTLDFAGP